MRALRPVFLALVLAAIGYRAAVAVTVSGTLDFYTILAIAQLDALAGGALLALVERDGGTIKSGRLLAWSLPVAVLLDLLCSSPGLRVTLVSSAYLLPMIAIVSGANAGYSGTAGAVLSNRAVVWVGRISYGIYLYHNFVAASVSETARMMGQPPIPDGPIRFLLFSAVTIAVAALSWFAIERPALSLKRHFGRADARKGFVPSPPTPA